MTASWPQLRIKDILQLHRRWVRLQPTTQYVEIGVRSFGRGLFHKAPVTGASLGDKRVLLIKNHGAVIFSQSLENATIEAMQLEVAARYHLEAEAIGGSEFPPLESKRGREAYHKYFLPQMWDANLRRLRRSDPDLFEWLEKN